ncbi:MAG: uracil-DNA glycosylase [Synergistales bacterium]|nr:uracil-DNA glycosylase [Synergistales bacterium]
MNTGKTDVKMEIEANMEEARKDAWSRLRELTAGCKKCPLAEGRKNVVFGDGNPSAGVMFIGEGPGADEDEQGIPFVGKAGKLLTKILESVEISRQEIYITNVVKCRPPGNRVPTVEEMTACDEYLQAQIALIRPKIIVCLGSTPTKWMLRTTEGITKIRGRWFNWRNISVMPMFHPSYLLRNASNKSGSPKHQTWLDIQEVKRRWEELGKKT